MFQAKTTCCIIKSKNSVAHVSSFHNKTLVMIWMGWIAYRCSPWLRRYTSHRAEAIYSRDGRRPDRGVWPVETVLIFHLRCLYQTLLCCIHMPGKYTRRWPLANLQLRKREYKEETAPPILAKRRATSLCSCRAWRPEEGWNTASRTHYPAHDHFRLATLHKTFLDSRLRLKWEVNIPPGISKAMNAAKETICREPQR